MSKWKRVSRFDPCPVCGKPDYCTRSIDGTAVKCARVQSEKPVMSDKGGSGWLHSLEEPLPPLPPQKTVEKKADWTAECRSMFNDPKAHQKRCELADQLRVSVHSLELLRVGIGWDEWNNKEFSSWPSRDSDGKCVGFIRRYEHAKRTNQGGSLGVFYTENWFTHPGPVFIVEGGSDVAACESANLSAIGRASNTHGAVWIRKMLKQCCPKKKVFVVGERDFAPNRRGTVAGCAPNCRGCMFCWPGLFGAKKVAAELNCNYVLVPEPYKDMRELLAAGGLWLDLIGLL